jgi:ATP-binding cassette, subfamily B, bacterial MsbA
MGLGYNLRATKPRMVGEAMRNFLRILRYSWPYRYRLLASILCALMVACLWSLNLSAIYPVLKILSTGQNLQQWVDGEIDNHQKQLNDPVKRNTADHLRNELKRLEQTPHNSTRETLEQDASQKIAKIEGELSDHATWVGRYQWLKAMVIRHLPEDSFLTFVWLMTAVVIGLVLKGIFEFLNDTLVGSVTNRTLFDLRNRFFRRALHQDVRQLAGTGTADLMARFTNDTEQIGTGLKVLYGRMIGEPLKAISCFVVACFISWKLTIVFIVLVPVAIVVLVRVSKLMRKAAKKVLERMSAMYKVVRETFDGVKAVKGFTREPHQRRQFREASREYLRKAMRVIYIDAAAGPIVEVLVAIAIGLALASGTYLVLTHSTHLFGIQMTSQPLEFATLLQLYAFLAATADPVRRLTSVYTKIQGGEAAANRIFELFDREPSVEANANGPRLTEVKEQIEFKNVCFSHNPGTPTLDGVTLNVSAGETIAVVGTNGCGKTTLLGLLPRFYNPDYGAIFIDGVNIRTAHLRSLRKMIGLVTQDTQLFEGTVAENIAYGKRGATREEVIEAAKKAHAHEFIEKLPEGYDTPIGDDGNQKSGGERQKIALARAILRNPSILILDEFTSQIDPKSEADIHLALREFVKGRTVFLITHKLHTTLEIADRIVVMDAGRVIDIGTHIELIARCSLYQRLCDPNAGRKAA